MGFRLQSERAGWGWGGRRGGRRVKKGGVQAAVGAGWVGVRGKKVEVPVAGREDDASSWVRNRLQARDE